MDIQKEREEFEQAVKESCGLSPESIFELGPTGEYKSDATYFGWFMWLQAKRRIQAVPQGFVLVPRELSDEEARKYAEALFHKVEDMAKYEHRDLSESEFESFKNRWLDARTLTIQFDWKEMIEAQEQSHE